MLSTYYVPETLLRTLYTLSYVVHTTILKLESVSSFMDGRTESQRGQRTYSPKAVARRVNEARTVAQTWCLSHAQNN